jgi:hypothetical protein
MKKKTKKKASRRVTLRNREFKVVGKGESPPGKALLHIWKVKGGHIVDIKGIPGDPMIVAHWLRDIYNAYCKAYEMFGADPDEVAAEILAHFGELLANDLPAVKAALERAEAMADRPPKGRLN